MKTLKQHINEALKINSKSKVINTLYKYFPDTKDELLDIIKQRIKSEGNECDLNDIDVSKITDMSFMFCNSIFNGDISNWNVSSADTMECMFAYSNFNGDISKWDVSNVADMHSMFKSSKFNGDISKWDVSNVKYMEFMFCNSGFNQDISNWVVKNDTFTKQMFEKCPIENKYKPAKFK
jgi:surface protein